MLLVAECAGWQARDVRWCPGVVRKSVRNVLSKPDFNHPAKEVAAPTTQLVTALLNSRGSLCLKLAWVVGYALLVAWVVAYVLLLS